MSRITASTGLISGLKSQDIIDQLLAFEGRPLKLAQDQITDAKAQQSAFLGLSGKLLAFQASVSALTRPDIANARRAVSALPTVLTAVAQPGADLGAYRIRAVRQAQTQQFLSAGFVDSTTTPVGAGTITVKLGGQIEPTTNLAVLNGGQGIARGKIRVTDRSGATAVVDLTTARTIADVLSAFDNVSGISVKASVQGDRLVLTDLTGQTSVNLAVQEVGGGSTAAGLGILGSSSTSSLVGSDVVKLAGGLRLDALNDGNGVRKVAGLDDFRVTLKDGTNLNVSLGSATTLQNVLDLLNQHSANGGKLTAAIASDGETLLLTDSTAGSGALTVTALNQSKAAFDLGIQGTASGATLTGKRVLAGLNTVLLRDLRGGAGVATPGSVQITNRAGASATIDLSQANTLADVTSAIRGAGLSLQVSINAAGHGLEITDTSGGTSSNLIIADVGGGTTAANLKLTANVAANRVDTGDLSLRYIAENTRLDQINGGLGFSRGKFQITSTAGVTSTIDLTGSEIQTVGDVINAINGIASGVTARINDTGDGILLGDTAAGAGQLTVAELGGKTAASLRLLGSGATSVDGAFRYRIDVGASDKLLDVLKTIGDSGAPLSASLVDDGGGTLPIRLLLSSKRPGEAGRLVIDTGTTGVRLSKLAEGVDAVLGLGTGAFGEPNVLFTSASNDFRQVVKGLDVTLLGTSPDSINVSVASDPQTLADGLRQFVDSFNKASAAVGDLTNFDTQTLQKGVLQADASALAARDRIFSAVTAQYGPADGSIRNFAQLGIALKGGRLSLDESVLNRRLANDPAAVQAFLSDAQTGAAKKVESVLKGFTDASTGIVQRKVDALDSRIEQLNERTRFLTAQLDSKRERLQKQFVSLELALAKIQGLNSSLTQLASAVNLAQNVGSSSSTK